MCAGQADRVEPAPLLGAVGEGARALPRGDAAVARRARRRAGRAEHAAALRGQLRPRARAGGGRAARPRAADRGPRRRAHAARLGQDRPHRRPARRHARPARLQDGQGAAASPAFLFRGGQQLQMSFYLLAAERQFPGRTVADAFLDYVDGGRQVPLDPAALKGEKFRELLRGMVDAIASGTFVQEHTAADFCDYKAVCGPAPAARACAAASRSTTRGCSACSACGTSDEPGGPPVDEAARERARRDHGTSLVIEAGAGTGKTTLLIDRIEALLRARRRPPRPDRGRDLHRERRHHHEAAPARAAGEGAPRQRGGAGGARSARRRRWRPSSARRSPPSTPCARPSSASGRWSAGSCPASAPPTTRRASSCSPRPGTTGSPTRFSPATTW